MNYFSPQWTLLAGILCSFFFQNHQVQIYASKYSSKLLQISIVLLGASLNFTLILRDGGGNFFLTFASVTLVFIVGILAGRLLKIPREQSLLITCGTAICGGSAISALAPVIKADNSSFTVSIGIVFLLNAVAVFIFPLIGQYFDLSQNQFALWAALAIHDTSSVVAASAQYGDQALATATIIKLTRALWIIPMVLVFSLRGTQKTKLSLPWFIVGFLIVSLIFTFINVPNAYTQMIKTIAKTGFSFTLFLIGLSFNWSKLKNIGFRSFGLGIGLWLMISTVSLTSLLIFS